jgi:hypothetical protein
MDITRSYLKELTYQVNGAAIEVHEAKLISYMKLLKAPKGIMINFNCTNIFKEGQKTYLSEFYNSLRD